MEIIFIGTGSGKTSLKRFHSSFIISTGTYNLLIDAGDGVSRALLSAGIEFNSINGILFTHFHPDHLNGISSLLIQMKMNSRTTALDIFVHENLCDRLIDFIETSYIFMERLGFELNFPSFRTNAAFGVTDGLKVTARENHHLSKYEANISDNSDLVSLSLLIYSGSRNVFYSGDIGSKEDLLLFKEKDIDVFITEVSHVELTDILEILNQQQKAQLFLTHISDEIGDSLGSLVKSLSSSVQNRITITSDRERYSI